MGFPCAGRPQEQHIIVILDESHGGEFGDLLAVESRLEIEIELLREGEAPCRQRLGRRSICNCPKDPPESLGNLTRVGYDDILVL